MKKFIALAFVTVGVTVSARAQWIVFDPTMNVQSIINTAQEIAKYVEMINNQVQQIQTLTDQLNEFKHYEDLFGDPKAVVLTTVQPLVNDLRKTEVGQTLTRRHRECPWICVPARHSKQQTIVQFSERAQAREICFDVGLSAMVTEPPQRRVSSPLSGLCTRWSRQPGLPAFSQEMKKMLRGLERLKKNRS